MGLLIYTAPSCSFDGQRLQSEVRGPWPETSANSEVQHSAQLYPGVDSHSQRLVPPSEPPANRGCLALRAFSHQSSSTH